MFFGVRQALEAQMAFITLIQSTNPPELGKRFKSLPDGSLQKRAVAQITAGTATAIAVATPADFAALLRKASELENTAIMSGRFSGANQDEPITLVTEKKLGRLLGCEGPPPGGVQTIDGELYAARLKRGIESGPWILIDADNPPGIPAAWAAMTVGERLEKLEPIVPGISTCARIEYRASSARVVKDGKEPGCATHAWIQISDPDKLDVLRNYLTVQSQLHGISFGSPRYSKETSEVIGAQRRTVVDLAVLVSGRLAFCAKPTVEAEGYFVADADVKIVNPQGGVLDVSGIALPGEAELAELRVKTGQSLSFSHGGGGITTTERSSLSMDTPIEIRGRIVPLHEVVADMAPGDKVRCEAPFRESQSEAAFIRMLDDGQPMLHDVGTGTSYFLSFLETYTCPQALKRIDLTKVADAVDTMRAALSGNVVPASASLAASLTQHKPSFVDLMSDTARIARVRKVPVGNVANISAVLVESSEWDGVFAFDEMADEIMLMKPVLGARTPRSTFKPHRLRDEDIIQAQVWLQRAGFRTIAKQVVIDAIALAANENIISPVRHYLEDLESRIGWSPQTHQPRIHTLATAYFGAVAEDGAAGRDPQYLAEVSRRFMVSAVARALEPGCKVDTMLVLESAQGKGKSTAAEDLFGKQFFSDSLPKIGTKEASDHVRGRWCIEIPELSAMNKSDVEDVKAFITRKVERYRRPYDRAETVYPRRCVFIGTTNQDTYLRDETGNRRFWPVPVGQIDSDALKRDRDVLWAEAVYWYRHGTQWHMPAHLLPIVEAAQESRLSRDIWHDALAGALEDAAEVSLLEAAGKLGLERARISRREQNRLSACLKGLGFEPKGKFTSGPYRNAVRYIRALASD
jgi:predicted P-loop ATPase